MCRSWRKHGGGAGKVLIYRYFNSFDGLLETVSELRSWLPDTAGLLEDLPSNPKHLLRSVHQDITKFIESDRACHQVIKWRHAVDNPITTGFSQ